MSYPIICLQIFHFTKWKCNKNYKYVVYEVSTFLCPIKADINMMEENMKKKRTKKRIIQNVYFYVETNDFVDRI